MMAPLAGSFLEERASAQACAWQWYQLNAAGYSIIGYDSIDAYGNVINALVDGEAYADLSTAITWGEITLSTIAIPGVGEVVVAVSVPILAAAAILLLYNWALTRGKYDPVQVGSK
jgi:hypothetical protein